MHTELIRRAELTRRFTRWRAPETVRKPAPIRDATLLALSVVTHYEDKQTGARVSKPEARLRKPNELYSIGLSFAAILKRVRKQFPAARIQERDLRWTATHVRYGSAGFERCTLPTKRNRPRGKRNARPKNR